ncbi:MAG: acyl carrier protein [Pseudodonghicola sp.]
MKKLDANQVMTWISAYLSDFLDLPEGAMTPEAGFADLGLDSADSIIIGGAFEEAFDVEVDAALFLRNENLRGLIEDLRGSGFIG